MQIHPLAYHLLQEARNAFAAAFGETPSLSLITTYATNILSLYIAKHPNELPQLPQWVEQPIPHFPRIPLNGKTAYKLTQLAEQLNISTNQALIIAAYLLLAILKQLPENI